MSKGWKFGDIIRQRDDIVMVLAPNIEPRHRNEEWYQVVGLRGNVRAAYQYGEIDAAYAEWWEKVDD